MAEQMLQLGDLLRVSTNRDASATDLSGLTIDDDEGGKLLAARDRSLRSELALIESDEARASRRRTCRVE